MAYNNFPVGYQSAQVYYPQQYNPIMQPQISTSSQMMTTQQQTQNNSIIWVQGEAGAKSYLVAPNNTVQLWDSENQVIYLKSADASGMPSMKVLDYKIRETEQAPHLPQVIERSPQSYITRNEFDAFENKINAKFDEILGKED